MAPAGTVVDTNDTMIAELAKKYLGQVGVPVHDGMHDRLRETAAAYLAAR